MEELEKQEQTTELEETSLTTETNQTQPEEAKQENSVEDVMQSVSDEYIAKKKRKRKITYSSILSVLFAIATIIIVMSTIRVDLKPSFVANPTIYEISISGKTETLDEGMADQERFEEFYKIYNQSFNVSYLTALFTGKLGGYEVNETLNKFYSNENTQAGMSQSLSDQLGNNYIKLSYATEHTIKNSNGSTYYSDYNTACELKFEDVYFPLNTEDKDSELTFYFGTTGIGMGYTITTITVRANTFALYEFAK